MDSIVSYRGKLGKPEQCPDILTFGTQSRKLLVKLLLDVPQFDIRSFLCALRFFAFKWGVLKRREAKSAETRTTKRSTTSRHLKLRATALKPPTNFVGEPVIDATVEMIGADDRHDFTLLVSRR